MSRSPDIAVRRAMARQTMRDHLHKMRASRGLEYAAADVRGAAEGIADYLRAVLGPSAAYTVLSEAADEAAFPTIKGDCANAIRTSR